jgi:RHS repeat-associated protein
VGNLKKLQYPDGRAVGHNYLKNDWLKKTETSDNNAQTFLRNKVGIPTKIDHSNSSWSEITYDKVYRPLEVFDRQQGSGNHLISKFNYTYNDLGHQTQEIAEYGWRQPAKVTTAFSYDGLHRLTQAQSDDGQKSQYVYDPVGNRLTMIEQLQQGPETRNYSFNAANQLTQVSTTSPLPPNALTTKYSYDKNGNRVDKLIADATGLDRGSEYTYDFENRPTQIQEYQYQLPATPAPTPSPTPEPSPTPGPTMTPSPSPSPCPGNGQGNNNGKDENGDCNNGGGNDDKHGSLVASASPDPSATPIPTATPEPSSSPTPTPASGTENQPSLAPENTVTTVAATDPVKNYLADTKLEYDGNGRRLISTYSPGNSEQLKRTEFTFDRLDTVVEHSMWNGQRNNLYRTTRNPITQPVQPTNPMHSQFTLNAHHQGADLAFFQEFKSEQDPNGTEYWYHYDGEKNIAATTKHKAQSDHTYRYDEYGLTLPDNGTSLGQVGSDNTQGSSGWDFPHNQYTLTQKYADPHTNLTYFGSRHYDPEVGVWLTQDSYRGAVPNPQSLHRYMYNYASPVNYQDQYGYCLKVENIADGCPAHSGLLISDSWWENAYLIQKVGVQALFLPGEAVMTVGDVMAVGAYYGITDPNYRKQGLEGAFSADPNKQNELSVTLRSAGQFSGADFALDIQDLHYDVTNWQWSGKHITTTAIDAIALCPVAGLIKVAAKADDIADAAKAVDRIDDISDVSKVNGRFPINYKYAGQTLPLEKLPTDVAVKYPESVKFTPQGFPDFSPYVVREVSIGNLTGDYVKDSQLANQAIGLNVTPQGYTWHHVEDGVTMQLVPQDLHQAVRHTGGAAVLR